MANNNKWSPMMTIFRRHHCRHCFVRLLLRTLCGILPAFFCRILRPIRPKAMPIELLSDALQFVPAIECQQIGQKCHNAKLCQLAHRRTTALAQKLALPWNQLRHFKRRMRHQRDLEAQNPIECPFYGKVPPAVLPPAVFNTMLRNVRHIEHAVKVRKRACNGDPGNGQFEMLEAVNCLVLFKECIDLYSYEPEAELYHRKGTLRLEHGTVAIQRLTDGSGGGVIWISKDAEGDKPAADFRLEVCNVDMLHDCPCTVMFVGGDQQLQHPPRWRFALSQQDKREAVRELAARFGWDVHANGVNLTTAGGARRRSIPANRGQQKNGKNSNNSGDTRSVLSIHPQAVRGQPTSAALLVLTDNPHSVLVSAGRGIPDDAPTIFPPSAVAAGPDGRRVDEQRWAKGDFPQFMWALHAVFIRLNQMV